MADDAARTAAKRICYERCPHWCQASGLATCCVHCTEEIIRECCPTEKLRRVVAALDRRLDKRFENEERLREENARLLGKRYRLREALSLPLLFHKDVWRKSDREEWQRITKSSDATTKVMCDAIRTVLAATEKPDDG